MARLRFFDGTFDWAYEEEFSCRDGFRWSPDSKSIAYWQLDATKVKNFLMIDNADSSIPFTVPVEYPVAGEKILSPRRVGRHCPSLPVKTMWMFMPGDSKQHYIAAHEWADNNTELVVEQHKHKQNEARVFFCKRRTGFATQIVQRN